MHESGYGYGAIHGLNHAKLTVFVDLRVYKTFRKSFIVVVSMADF